MAGEARAQDGAGVVRGTVTTTTGLPLGGVQLRLSGVTAESDETGLFALRRVPMGTAWLIARRIGFRPDSVRVRVGKDPVTVGNLRLDRLAVELAAVTVLGRRDLTGHLAGFYRRMSYGIGRFFTAADIEQRNAMRMTDLLRMIPGMRIDNRGFTSSVRIRGSRCAPLVWLDGQPMYAGEVDVDNFDPRTFDGVEVYSGAASVPVEFQGNQRMSSACGTIVLWSKRGEPRARRRRNNEPTPAARVAMLLSEGKAFLPDEVDAGARPDSSQLIRPIYPDSLFEVQTGGRVVAEFVVTPAGEAVMNTFSAVTTTHRQFVEPVRRAVQEQRFTPAVRNGLPVQQVLQLPFEFIPDSTARRRR
jgi:hypothetical protein